jgi:dephospho-CoA kinase
MLILKKIAVTGGIASGKTSVCQFFRDLGAFIVNADAIAHKLLESDSHLQRQIVREFGAEILKNGKIDRKILANKVFRDPRSLQKLEALMHPLIFSKVKKLYHQAKKARTYTSFVVEMPLLFETRAEKFYDITLTITANESLAKERFTMQGFPETEYPLRMQRHLSVQEKQQKSDYTIENNGSLEDLQKKIIFFNQTIQQRV